MRLMECRFLPPLHDEARCNAVVAMAFGALDANDSLSAVAFSMVLA